MVLSAYVQVFEKKRSRKRGRSSHWDTCWLIDDVAEAFVRKKDVHEAMYRNGSEENKNV